MRTRLLRLVHLLVGWVLTFGLVTRFHRAVYRASRSRFLGSGLGLPMVLLTTTGRVSGRPRTVPLTGFLDGTDVVVVGSNDGRDRDPAWVTNVRSHPAVTVQLAGRMWAARAHLATQTEAARLWPIVVRGFGGYGTYRTRTDRPIPLVVLEPASEADATRQVPDADATPQARDADATPRAPDVGPASPAPGADRTPAEPA
jgi:deazaflavin-dependent oxidoreductase (nitroreductase family)